ncbi:MULTISPECIES: metal/formaldehyde-sensitive transcriptional repressor [Alphaproteobacteria]|uniref:metal/formaldehyde-sensitive transcriptional repressor n=1 Tax=Alphaproteobacteria TaxID=28211 RepID=UPI003CC876B9
MIFQESAMPHSPEDKKRAITRLRRIKGQAEALERAIEAGTDCAPLLQQIVAMRGATNGLMAEVMESHLKETFGPSSKAIGGQDGDSYDNDMEGVMKILRTYLK